VQGGSCGRPRRKRRCYKSRLICWPSATGGSSIRFITRSYHFRMPRPCSQKTRASVLLAPTYRHNKFPTALFLGTSSSLHDERIVSWVKFFTHALLDGDGRVKFQTKPLDNSVRSYAVRQLAAMLVIIDDGRVNRAARRQGRRRAHAIKRSPPCSACSTRSRILSANSRLSAIGIGPSAACVLTAPAARCLSSRAMIPPP